MQGIRLVGVDSIADLVKRLNPQTRYFTLLLAWDAPDIPQDKLIDMMRPLVERGLVYICAWGGRCEQVHDAVDDADLERINITGSDEYVIMTTWHSQETLSEACWFFKELAFPSEEPYISNLERFAVAVGNDNWLEEMRMRFEV